MALYHCPRRHYGYKGEREEETKPEAPPEASRQFKITDPISMADLENIHTRRGKYPSQPPPFRPKTWEMARKEKEERVLKEKRERPLSTPLGTTSTNAMDTEEAQEFSKEIAEKAIERELKKQKYEQYQWVKQPSNYQVPKSITIPVPDLNKPIPEKESRPTSVLSNFDVPLYEEMVEPKEGQLIRFFHECDTRTYRNEMWGRGKTQRFL